MPEMSRPVVTIVQRVLPQYRIPFFSGLKDRLGKSGISLRLVYGQEFPGTVPRTVACDEEWCQRITNRYIRLAGLELVWQPCLAQFEGSDLIIVEQANRLLVNYSLIRKRKQRKVAYFGHGRNMQAGSDRSFRERGKRFLLGKADWWFAYTGMTADIVAGAGFPRDRITVVGNTIDTTAFSRELAAVSAHDREALKARLGLKGSNIVLFCGGMNGGKRLGFVLEACLALRGRLADFAAIFIGDGPELPLVEDAARRYPWIRCIGPLFAGARAPYFRLGKALLLPGSVGLAIIDGFVAQVPLITTDMPGHGPEIGYLENGVNGIMTRDDLGTYVEAIASLLASESLQGRLMEGCRRSAEKQTMENMIGNFAAGVEQCLSRP